MTHDDRDSREIELNKKLNAAELPEGWDRRAFMMRSAMIGAAVSVTLC